MSSSSKPAASFLSYSVASSPGHALKIEAVNKRLIFGLPLVMCCGSVKDAAPIFFDCSITTAALASPVLFKASSLLHFFGSS